MLIEVALPEELEPDPNDPPYYPPRSYVNFMVSGVDRLPEPPPGEQRVVGAYFAPADDYDRYNTDIFPAEGPVYASVRESVTSTPATGSATSRLRCSTSSKFPAFRRVKSERCRSIFSIPIETPVAFEVGAPASPISRVRIGMSVVLPNEGASLYLTSTSTGGGPLLAPKLEGQLANASLIGIASKFKQEPPSYGWEDIAVFVTLDSTDETIRFSEWPTRTGEVTLVERTFRLPVDGVDRCRFRIWVGA